MTTEELTLALFMTTAWGRTYDPGVSIDYEFLRENMTAAKEDTHIIRIVFDRVVAILKEDIVHHFPRPLGCVGVDLPSTTVGSVCLVYKLPIQHADGLRQERLSHVRGHRRHR